MNAAPAIVHTPREQWLLRRRSMLTASDVAAVLGFDPRRGPLAVYLDKIGLDTRGEDERARRWLRFGRDVEGAIANWYSDETGRLAVDLGAHEIQIHPDLPWLGATLDRQTGGSPEHPDPFRRQDLGDLTAPLEIKAAASTNAREWADEPPLHYQVQLQAQMACTRAQWGSLCALIGGVTLAWRDLLRDDAFLAAALPKLEAFWARVQRRDQPEADALPGTSEAIRRAWPTDDGETVDLGPHALALVEEREAAQQAIESAERRKALASNQLRALMGPATFGALVDGSWLSLRTVKRARYVVEETSYRELRRVRPRLPRRRV